MIFENYDDLALLLRRDVEVALERTKKNYIDNEMQQAIEDTVYAIQFDSMYPYERRGDGGVDGNDGLKNKKNFSFGIISNPPTSYTNGEVIMKIRNVANGNTDYPNHDDGYIDKIIITGKGYSWENSAYYQAEYVGKPIKRDFYKETKKRMKGNLGGALEKELKRMGW